MIDGGLRPVIDQYGLDPHCGELADVRQALTAEAPHPDTLAPGRSDQESLGRVTRAVPPAEGRELKCSPTGCSRPRSTGGRARPAPRLPSSCNIGKPGHRGHPRAAGPRGTRSTSPRRIRTAWLRSVVPAGSAHEPAPPGNGRRAAPGRRRWPQGHGRHERRQDQVDEAASVALPAPVMSRCVLSMWKAGFTAAERPVVVLQLGNRSAIHSSVRGRSAESSPASLPGGQAVGGLGEHAAEGRFERCALGVLVVDHLITGLRGGHRRGPFVGHHDGIPALQRRRHDRDRRMIRSPGRDRRGPSSTRARAAGYRSPGRRAPPGAR